MTSTSIPLTVVRAVYSPDFEHAEVYTFPVVGMVQVGDRVEYVVQPRYTIDPVRLSEFVASHEADGSPCLWRVLTGLVDAEDADPRLESLMRGTIKMGREGTLRRASHSVPRTLSEMKGTKIF